MYTMIDETYTTEVKLAWLAGWFEGEGSIVATKPSKHGGSYISIRGASTDEDVIDFLQKNWQGSKSGPLLRLTPSGSPAKPIYTWQLTRTQECIELIEKLYPFLSTRRQKQVDKVLATQKWAVMPTIEERFDNLTEKTEDGCLIWQGHIDRFGFGTWCQTVNQRIQAHRFSFQREFGYLPSRLKNICGSKSCVNPYHWRSARDES